MDLARDFRHGDAPRRRRIVRSVAAAVLVAALGCGPDRDPTAGPAAATEPPPVHLLLITLDTLRADHLGAYGYDAPTSPAIDGLARTATLFEDVTCSMPTTLPSHLTILTGLTPAQHGVTENGRVPERDLTSIFELLAPRGARTAAVVSAGVVGEKYLTGLGIGEIFYQPGGGPRVHQVPADAVTDRAIAWLTEHGDGPFALWLHYFDAHEPYTPPAAYASRFTRGYDGPLSDSLPTQWLISLNGDAVSDLSARDRRHVADLYDAEIAFLDAQLDRLFVFLRDSQLWRETLIVLTGDHGQAHGESGFWGHGERLLEPVIKVPLVVKLPDQEGSAVVRSPAQTLDLVPTLAAYYGLETPTEAGGRSLLPALLGNEPEPLPLRVVERRTYSSTDPGRRGLALHGGTWKLTFYRDPEGPSYHLGRITGEGGLDGEDFHVPGTPEEGLLRRIVAERQEQRIEARELSPETLEMLRSLGYVE